MAEYEELIKALRCCGNVNTDCTVCPWDKYNFGMCAEKLYTDAAAAIEALQRELNLAEIAADDNGRQVEKLQAEVKRLEPKRGEWVHLYKNNFRCSLCGSWFIFEDENNPYEDGRFCSYCGAKMTGAQE